MSDFVDEEYESFELPRRASSGRADDALYEDVDDFDDDDDDDFDDDYDDDLDDDDDDLDDDDGDAFDDLGAGRVEFFDVAAKQHFARQAKRPTFVGQFEALLFEHRHLHRGQAFGGGSLAATQGQ